MLKAIQEKLFRRIAIGMVVVASATAHLAGQQLPTRLTDAEFWKLVTDFSEPSGQFHSENFTSNEATFQRVMPELSRTIKPGGVYLGVGPEQNFSYMLAVKPAMGFIVDIRRQNMLQHLIYKAMFELSTNRADFISMLFSRPRPAGLDTMSTADALFAAIDQVRPDSALNRRSFIAVTDQLTKRHGFTLSREDMDDIQHVFDAFYLAGPSLSYGYTVAQGMLPPGGRGVGGGRGGRGGGGIGITLGNTDYRTIMVQDDGHGVNRTYLATEANFRAMRDMQLRNVIVPLVGDFSGPKALKSVGEYVKAHGAVISVFYSSNVEQYLFDQGDQWSRFYTTLGGMPFDASSTFIRSLNSQTEARHGGPPVVLAGATGPMTFPSALSSVQSILSAFKAGKLTRYRDVMMLSHQ